MNRGTGNPSFKALLPQIGRERLFVTASKTAAMDPDEKRRRFVRFGLPKVQNVSLVVSIRHIGFRRGDARASTLSERNGCVNAEERNADQGC
jgi:hypothetical protein